MMLEMEDSPSRDGLSVLPSVYRFRLAGMLWADGSERLVLPRRLREVQRRRDEAPLLPLDAVNLDSVRDWEPPVRRSVVSGWEPASPSNSGSKLLITDPAEASRWYSSAKTSLRKEPRVMRLTRCWLS